MEGSGFGGLFGDPDDLQRRLGEFAEQMQGAQRLAWADNAIKLAVDLTVAAMNRANIQGTTERICSAGLTVWNRSLIVPSGLITNVVRSLPM